jgi:hypothetical protein
MKDRGNSEETNCPCPALVDRIERLKRTRNAAKLNVDGWFIFDLYK